MSLIDSLTGRLRFDINKLMRSRPGLIDAQDTELYTEYDREFAVGERVVWLKQLGTVVAFAFKAKHGLPSGYDVYRVKLDDVRAADSADKEGVVDAFRGQLRAADSVAGHALVT